MQAKLALINRDRPISPKNAYHNNYLRRHFCLICYPLFAFILIKYVLYKLAEKSTKAAAAGNAAIYRSLLAMYTEFIMKPQRPNGDYGT